jgi:hypothetical protein
MTIEDGALGTLPPNTAGASVKIGVCSRGIPNTMKGYSDIKALQADLGQGPLVEAVSKVLDEAGGPVYAVPITPSVTGSVGAVTHTGPGVGTVTPSVINDRIILAKITTAGVLGTMAVSFNVNGEGYGTPVLSSASAPWDKLVDKTLSTLRFPSGTYLINEVYTVSLKGVVTQSGAGPVVVRQAGNPIDVYSVIVEIVTEGGVGVGAFTYSLDGGNNFSPVIAIPGDGLFPIPGAGILLTFASTFTKGDDYSFTTVAAGYSSSDVNSAMDAILALPQAWDHAHVVGAATNAAGAKVIAAGVQTKLDGAETRFRYAYGVTECPTGESDSTLSSTFADLVAPRVMVCAGDAGVRSPLTGRINRRNAAWVVTARIAKIKPGEDPSWVGRGALKGVDSLYRNEASTPLLDEARFTTLRTHLGLAGYYITNARMMAPGGSDFTYVQHRRVMDVACTVARAAELPYLNQDVRVDEKTGFIDEKDAQQFEAEVASKLRTAVVATGDASAASVVLSRNVNLLTGTAQPVTVRVVPKAYLKHIETSIGFSNPALAAA